MSYPPCPSLKNMESETHPMTGLTMHEISEENARLTAENHALRGALQRIYYFPVYSEPVGGAYAMQDIAYAVLKPLNADSVAAVSNH
jgi:hypothetical protein